jgi:hypothetical protein
MNFTVHAKFVCFVCCHGASPAKKKAIGAKKIPKKEIFPKKEIS